MSMQLKLILSSLLPLVLALILASFTRQTGQKDGWKSGLGLLLAYIPSYLWIAGIPSLPPAQAVGWVGFIGISSFAVISVINIHKAGPGKKLIVLFSAFSVSIILLSWPILRYSFNTLLAVELAIFLIIWVGTGLLVLQPTGNKSIPLSMTGAGFALVAALGGSMLIGQLTGALAAALGGFALHELISQKERLTLNAEASFLSVSLLGSIVLVGWQYAEIPYLPLISIIVGSVIGLFLFKRNGKGWRFIALNTLAMSVPILFGLAWLVMTSDNSGYY